MSRDQTACMMRVKNEARWIRRSLERTWQVAARVVVLDDGSTDETREQASLSLTGGHAGLDVERLDSGALVLRGASRELHWLPSPFANAGVRPEERANEIRDKNMLWYYLKAHIPFTYVLCLDGDEMLSRVAIRRWPELLARMDGGADYLTLPFVYLWDREDQQRCDAIYGPEDVGHKRLRFPRVFTIQRLSERDLFDTRFDWRGTRGGFHCGSIPQEGFRPGGAVPRIEHVEAPVIHFGYIDHDLRHRKFEFYNRIDPGNEFEGYYLHVIGQPSRHAPGPPELAPYEDA